MCNSMHLLCNDVVNLQRERKVQEGGARGRCIKGTRWCWISVLQQISLLWESLWENALVCGERCMRKIWWLVKALCHRYNGEDCTHLHYIITILKDVLNSINSDLSTVVF